MSEPGERDEAPQAPAPWGDPWRRPTSAAPAPAAVGWGPPPAQPEEHPQPQHPQLEYAQPEYAQPEYAQPEYAQPEYAQPEYAQPEYAQPEYAQPEYAQPEYAQPEYAQQQATPYPPPAGSQTITWPVQAAPVGPGRRRGGALIALAVALGLIAGLAGGVGGAWLLDRSQGTSALRDTRFDLGDPTPGTTTRPADSVAGVANTVLPSVVAILVSGADGEGTGSGFVVDGDKGYVLTNNHVVASAADSGTIKVVLDSGEQEEARIVGRDPSYDLAVIKIERTDLRALEFGDSDSVVVGDAVIAIGAPLGLQGTVTTGIVSALNRPVTAGDGTDASYINAVQTDAAINPGNSGGPLVDDQGRVIGVNSAIARSPGSVTGQSGSIGLGFAIPAKQAQRTAEQLITTGKAEHPIIGVYLDESYEGEGVKVIEEAPPGRDPVAPDGPADRAGIRAGDVIVAFNGRPVTEPDELVVAIRAQTPGDTVTLTVRRAGVDREVVVTLSGSTS